MPLNIPEPHPVTIAGLYWYVNNAVSANTEVKQHLQVCFAYLCRHVLHLLPLRQDSAPSCRLLWLS